MTIPIKLATMSELYYLGGYFDGEGCISMASGKKKPQLQVKVISGDEEIIHYFYEVLGGAFRSVNNKPREANRQLYEWAVYGSNAQDALAQLAPFLRGAKREAAFIALDCDYCNKGRQSKVPPDELTKRINIAARISAINQRRTIVDASTA